MNQLTLNSYAVIEPSQVRIIFRGVLIWLGEVSLDDEDFAIVFVREQRGVG